MTFLVNFVFGRLEKLDGAILGGGGGEGGAYFRDVNLGYILEGRILGGVYIRGVY